jgi:hypothetical protein
MLAVPVVLAEEAEAAETTETAAGKELVPPREAATSSHPPRR